MTAIQTQASKQFLTAMGTMVENPSAMQQVIYYINWMKKQPEIPVITMKELEENGMPLHTAMEKLRNKARKFYQVQA